MGPDSDPRQSSERSAEKGGNEVSIPDVSGGAQSALGSGLRSLLGAVSEIAKSIQPAAIAAESAEIHVPSKIQLEGGALTNSGSIFKPEGRSTDSSSEIKIPTQLELEGAPIARLQKFAQALGETLSVAVASQLGRASSFVVSGRGEKDLAHIIDSQKGDGRIYVWAPRELPDTAAGFVDIMKKMAASAANYAGCDCDYRKSLDPNPGGIIVGKYPYTGEFGISPAKDPRYGETTIEINPRLWNSRISGVVPFEKIRSLVEAEAGANKKMADFKSSVEKELEGLNPEQAKKRVRHYNEELYPRHAVIKEIAQLGILARCMEVAGFPVSINGD